MVFIRESVPDRHPAVLCKFLDGFLRKTAELDTVKHPAKHTRGILHALLVPKLYILPAKVFRMPALVYATYGKGTARPGGRLLKNQRDILAL